MVITSKEKLDRGEKVQADYRPSLLQKVFLRIAAARKSLWREYED